MKMFSQSAMNQATIINTDSSSVDDNYGSCSESSMTIEPDCSLTKEQKRVKRVMANRKSAKVSRQRRKLLLSTLQGTVGDLTEENVLLSKTNETLRQGMIALQQRNSVLELMVLSASMQQGRQLQGNSATITSGSSELSNLGLMNMLETRDANNTTVRTQPVTTAAPPVPSNIANAHTLMKLLDLQQNQTTQQQSHTTEPSPVSSNLLNLNAKLLELQQVQQSNHKQQNNQQNINPLLNSSLQIDPSTPSPVPQNSTCNNQIAELVLLELLKRGGTTVW